MSNIQVVNLADNINAAILKINQNFAGLDSAVGNITIDSADITNIINNVLDSDYFLTVINEEYLQQFTIETDVSYLDSDISANASAILQLESRIDATDSGVLVLAQAQIATQAQLDSMVLGGIDSDLLAAAIANANTTLTSLIEANDSAITVLAGIVDSVNAELILLDTSTDTRITANANAVSDLYTRIDATDSDLSIVAANVTQLDVNLQQLIDSGITISDSDVIEAVGGALQTLETRIDTNESGITVLSQAIDSVSASLISVDSDLNARVDAEADARSVLSSTVSTQGGQITSISNSLTELDNAVFIRDPVTGDVTSTAITGAIDDLRTEITEENGLIQSAISSYDLTLQAQIDSDIAAAEQSLTAYVDAQTGGVSAQWQLNLTAGTTTDPYVAGLEFTNDGSTADFVVAADTFKIVTPTATDGSGGVNPFTVTANGVELSNATVTGQIDIGTDLTGTDHMEITNERIDIYEGSARRVRIGLL